MSLSGMLGHRRATVVLLHPSCLPDPPGKAYGIGELGSEAFRFVDFLHESGTLVWQTLPLGHPNEGEFSPYQTFSRFGGSPYLISVEELARRGDITAAQERAYMDRVRAAMGQGILGPGNANPAWLLRHKIGRDERDKSAILRIAFRGFLRKKAGNPRRQAFARFCESQGEWVRAYADYMALREAQGGKPWNRWPAPMRAWNRWNRERAGILARSPGLARAIRFYEYVQFVFDEQWRSLRAHAASRGRLLMGDLPWYVGYDSADVWARPEVFDLDKKGRPRHVAGVPPDYFSRTGQLWGNPVYNWDNPAAITWWAAAVEFGLSQMDILRMDHFRAIDTYWKIPREWAERYGDARGGCWAKAPGALLLQALAARLALKEPREKGRAAAILPIIAEDLGALDPICESPRKYPARVAPGNRYPVDRAFGQMLRRRDSALEPGLNARTGVYDTRAALDHLMAQFGLPWMAVLQFGFEGDPRHLPARLPEDAIAYTGTHDNNTALGWYLDMVARENRGDGDNDGHPVCGASRFNAQRQLLPKATVKTEQRCISREMMAHALSSKAALAGMPFQDLLGLGAEGRMNLPGDTKRLWWTWRALPEQVNYDKLAVGLADLNRRFRRFV